MVKAAQSTTLRKTKPSYKKLILKALKESPNSARKGTSPQFIAKYIQDRYETPSPQLVRRYVSKRLKQMQADKEVDMIRRSFRLTAKGRNLLKEKNVKNIKKAKSVLKKLAKKVKKSSKLTSSKKVSRRTTTKRTARRTNSSTNNSTSTASVANRDYIWQFYDNGFNNYDLEASDAVEEEYQKYLLSPGSFDVRSVKSGAFHYFVDFRQFTQQNIDHPNHTVRKIRRVRINSAELENNQL